MARFPARNEFGVSECLFLSTRSLEEAEHLGEQLGVGSRRRPWLRTIRRRLMQRYCIPYVFYKENGIKGPCYRTPKTSGFHQ